MGAQVVSDFVDGKTQVVGVHEHSLAALDRYTRVKSVSGELGTVACGKR